MRTRNAILLIVALGILVAAGTLAYQGIRKAQDFDNDRKPYGWCLVRVNTSLCAVDLASGTVEQVLDLGDYRGTQEWIASAGDEHKLIQVGYGKVQVINTDTGGITPAGDGHGGLCVSPDGKQVAFLTSADEAYIVIMDVDSLERTQIPAAARAGSELAWSPDGSLLYYIDRHNWFSAYHIGDQTKTRIVHGMGYPVLSPDGENFAYASRSQRQIISVNLAAQKEDAIAPSRVDTARLWVPGDYLILGRLTLTLKGEGAILVLLDMKTGREKTLLKNPASSVIWTDNPWWK